MSEATTFVPGVTPHTEGQVEFQTSPEVYRHWRLSIDVSVATLSMDVDENGGLKADYSLKLNSYDLGVDIELYDAVQRLRFEHPEVHAVIIKSERSAYSVQAPTLVCLVLRITRPK